MTNPNHNLHQGGTAVKNPHRSDPDLKDLQTVQFPDQIQEQIRQRAYELYEQRGREDGHDLDDWLAAESEVNGSSKREAA